MPELLHVAVLKKWQRRAVSTSQVKRHKAEVKTTSPVTCHVISSKGGRNVTADVTLWPMLRLRQSPIPQHTNKEDRPASQPTACVADHARRAAQVTLGDEMSNSTPAHVRQTGFWRVSQVWHFSMQSCHFDVARRERGMGGSHLLHLALGPTSGYMWGWWALKGVMRLWSYCLPLSWWLCYQNLAIALVCAKPQTMILHT